MQDDCWERKVPPRDPTSNVLVGDPVRFPAGMKALGDYYHSKGSTVEHVPFRSFERCTEDCARVLFFLLKKTAIRDQYFSSEVSPASSDRYQVCTIHRRIGHHVRWLPGQQGPRDARREDVRRVGRRSVRSTGPTPSVARPASTPHPLLDTTSKLSAGLAPSCD